MGIVRNFIDIIGITPEDELPDKNNGQIIEYSEVENIFIPEHHSRIRNIFQIMVKVEIKSTRTVNAPLGKVIIVDGIKRLKIIYEDRGDSKKANIVNLEVPYNTFIELQKGAEILDNIEIYIMDAYFHSISPRTLYSHVVYLIHIHYARTEKAEPKYIVTLDADGKQADWETPYGNSESNYVDEMLMTGDTSVTFLRKSNARRLEADEETRDYLTDIESEYL